LRVTWEKGASIKSLYATIPDTEKFRRQIIEQLAAGGYKVKRGDTLSSIALRAGMSTKELMRLNGITDPNRIFVGQRLYIPTKAELVAVSEKPEPSPAPAEKVAVTAPQGLEDGMDQAPVGPMVPPELKKSTAPEKKELVTVQRVPVVNPSIAEPAGTAIIVASDETMGHYADWLEIPTQRLRNLNGLAYGKDIRVGQKIHLAFNNVGAEEFHRRRMEYHRGIREDFYQRFRVDTVQTHVVARGENIWVLCKEIYEVPLWLALEYNSDKNLEKLKAGDALLFPIVTAN
jgi:membrane-bound lytic murein transglycosylase D